MSLILINIYLFILALNLAILEIQIEGKHGWAENLPTWRPAKDTWVQKIFARINFGKQLTGYFLAINCFVLLTLHLPFIFGLSLNFSNWLKIISLWLVFVNVWDLLWFVLNPNFGLGRFKKEFVPWHKIWFLGLPADYWAGISLSFLALTPYLYFTQSFDLVLWWLTNFAVFIFEILVVIIFAQIFLHRSK